MNISANPGIREPRFAVVKLGIRPDLNLLFAKLQELGYFEISFVHDLCDSPYFSAKTATKERRGRKRRLDCKEVARSISPQNTSTPGSTSLDNEHMESDMKEAGPLARIEIVEKDLNLLDQLGVIIGDREEGCASISPIIEGQINASPNDGNQQCYSSFDFMNESTILAGRPHGFARERDYKYKLESGIQDCEECGRQFVQSQFKNILAHAKSHYQVKPWGCPECEEQAVDIDSMRVHIAIEHPHVISASPISNGVACERLRDEWAQVARKCFPNLRNRIDKWEANVHKIHAAQKKTKKEDNDSETISEQDANNLSTLPSKWVGNLHIPCKLCTKVLACRDVSILVRHAKTHHPVKQFACQHCEYTNAERRNMRQHIEATHANASLNDFHDQRSASMEESWVCVGSECFPEMADRLQEAIHSYKPKAKVQMANFRKFEQILD